MRFILALIAAVAAGFLLGHFSSRAEQLKFDAIERPSVVKGGRIKRE